MALRMHPPLRRQPQLQEYNGKIRQQNLPRHQEKRNSVGKSDGQTPSNLYVDKNFPTRWDSLFCPFDAVSWMRPHEICVKPQLFVDGGSRFDVNQGVIGERLWYYSCLAASCSAVAERPELLKQIIPEGQVLHGPGYDGSVRFRLWSVGGWEDVRVDDRLPVDALGKPVYTHSKQDNEFWPALLEKAFAKMAGSYQKLQYFGCGALLRLTGFINQNFKIRSINSDKHFRTMTDALDEGALIVGTVLFGGPGLPGMHYYNINKTFRLPKNKNNGEEVQLVRVRNPWGNEVEWTGAWKYGDARWTMLSKATLEALEYNNQKDGEFWMEMKDFVDAFYIINIAIEKPRHCKGMKIIDQIKGKWTEEFSGGRHDEKETFFKNPQFLLWAIRADSQAENNVEDCGSSNGYADVYVELVQQQDEDGGSFSNTGVYIYELQASAVDRKLSQEQLLAARAVACSGGGEDEEPEQEPSGSAVCSARLQPGRRYVAVAASSRPGRESAFLLRVYAARPSVRVRDIAA